jgi:hypothetical protein
MASRFLPGTMMVLALLRSDIFNAEYDICTCSKSTLF